MVVKIQPPSATVASAVDYNEKKVAEGVASVAFSSKIDDPADAMATFQLYENSAVTATNLGFHASINPSPEDFEKMSKGDIIAFTREWMQRMGYGEQPFIIYEHTDNKRKHYHVLSVRVDINGKKINEWRERIRCSKIICALAPKYGYVVGKAHDNGNDIKTGGLWPRFDPDAGHAAKQIRQLADFACKYHFTSVNQYVALLRDMGVKIEFLEPKPGKPKVHVYGIDLKKRCICTVKMDGKRLGVPTLKVIEATSAACKRTHPRKEAQRVGRLAAFCLKHSTTKLHFDRMLRKQNITVKYTFDPSGKLTGATFIDHQTRCVFDLDDLRKNLKTQELADKMSKVWPPFDHSDKLRDKPQVVSKIDRQVEKFLKEMIDISLEALENSPVPGKDKKRSQEAQIHKKTYHG